MKEKNQSKQNKQMSSQNHGEGGAAQACHVYTHDYRVPAVTYKIKQVLLNTLLKKETKENTNKRSTFHITHLVTSSLSPAFNLICFWLKPHIGPGGGGGALWGVGVGVVLRVWHQPAGI